MDKRLHDPARVLALTEQYGRVGYWEVDIASNIVYWSGEVFNIHARDRSKGMPPLEEAINYYHPDDAPIVQAAVDKSAAEGEPFDIYGARIIREDNETRFVYARGEVELGPNGDPVRIMGIFRDVTEAKRSEDRLIASEERFRLAAAGSSVGIWDWIDVNAQAEIWTDQFYELIGYTPKELPASLDAFQSILHPEDQVATFGAVEQHFANGAPFRVDYRLRHKTLGYRWFLGSAQASFDPSGNPIRMVGSIQDIHERKLAQERLAEANRELERFAAIASHDLQEPLRKIGQFSHLLKRELDGKLNERQSQYFSFLEDASIRLQALISGLLAYSRLGEIAVNKEICYIKEIAESVWTQRLSDEHGDAQLEVASNAQVFADPDLLRQLLQNLLGNALKYRRKSVPLSVKISVYHDDDMSILTVSDNGIGFSKANSQRIFDIFTRLHRKEDYPGTGLGLALCARVMELHGGKISAAGELENGATFSASFPKQRDYRK